MLIYLAVVNTHAMSYMINEGQLFKGGRKVGNFNRHNLAIVYRFDNDELSFKKGSTSTFWTLSGSWWVKHKNLSRGRR